MLVLNKNTTLELNKCKDILQEYGVILYDRLDLIFGEFEILRNKKPEILRLRVLIFHYTVVLRRYQTTKPRLCKRQSY